MRKSERADGVSVQAIAGSHSVLLAMSATDDARRDLLGFGIGRTHANGSVRWLNGFKFFEDLIPSPKPGETRSTLQHPIQSFLWGHYTADPATQYRYVIRPLYRPDNGDLGNMRAGTDVRVTVRTEPVDTGTHTILFNRGAVPSQAFARQFGNRPPADMNDPKAEDVRWLSRTARCRARFHRPGARWPLQLRAALYEFSYRPIMDAFAEAKGSGADVKIVYEASSQKVKSVIKPTATTKGNEQAIDDFGFDRGLLIKRLNRAEIPHNKFIVLLDNDRPVQVWTGSTNITPSGFLGQSNVGHIIRDEAIARAFLEYWKQLAGTPSAMP